MKSLGVAIGILMLDGFIGYPFRAEIFRQIVGHRTHSDNPVGPNESVTWSTGSVETEEERPPNIILIVADDLGWNVLTINGGGVTGGTVPSQSDCQSKYQRRVLQDQSRRPCARPGARRCGDHRVD